MKIDIIKSLKDLLKNAGATPDQTGDVHPLKASADKLAAAMASYGDGAGLPADHPLHALKALHKEMTDVMCAAETEKAAKAEEAAKAATEEGDDAVTKAAIQEEVNKGLESIKKQLEDANKRATDAEAIAKSERDAREVEVEKTTLRKFRHVTVNVDADAPMFAKMRQSDKATYDFMIGKLNAAEEVAKKANLLAKDLGSPLGGDGQTAWAEIEAEAAKIVAKGEKGMTKEKAIDMVMKNQPELVKRYNAEQAGSPS